MIDDSMHSVVVVVVVVVFPVPSDAVAGLLALALHEVENATV